ncbi:hypothetical protein PGT21_010103 [Puccinia graminis f. sp. tritici]|uniref:Uncharacterized protein n=1 Tax=Puccinia graminis f. sp. tritici TaxID=56615 RepID=A0A5B0M407_PUCGR|nr:hypothetical protein PGTUg99_030054 [Puccinia graminis f. sp. tritici]KAA1071505.1 hypothetical protein PGT21_010103 [Puccinia graminis f. sp. tritici]
MMILDPDRHQATDETSPKPASQYGWTCSSVQLSWSVQLSTKFRTDQIRAEIFRTSRRLRFSAHAYVHKVEEGDLKPVRDLRPLFWGGWIEVFRELSRHRRRRMYIEVCEATTRNMAI